MMTRLCKFLSRLMVAVFLLGGFTVPAHSFTTNVPDEFGMADVGDYGSWATENNRRAFLSSLTYDLDDFIGSATEQQLVDDYVPIEAKLGLAFMNAFSHIGHVLDHSLVHFIIVFIVIMFGLWVAFEAYTIIIAQNKVQDKVIEIFKQGLKVVAWSVALSYGLPKLFVLFANPIMYVGTLISDIVLSAASSIADIRLPNTCGAIHQYVQTHISSSNIIDATSAANLMCVPTRIVGFLRTVVALGWKWMQYGIGNSIIIFLAGGWLIYCFIRISWTFAFIVFGVIADLFLGIIMLPFTAVAETVGKTSYKGIAGDMFNGFTKLFNAENLKKQVERVVNAALHFFSMSIIVAVCVALLSLVYSLDPTNYTPNMENPSFIITALVTALVVWLAKNASAKATEIGGSITTDVGDELKSNIDKMWQGTKKQYKDFKSALKKS